MLTLSETPWFPLRTPRLLLREFRAEAAHALVKTGFDVLGLHRIWATCDARNSGSIAILEKLGLRREGTLLQSQRAREGWRDTYLYAALDNEWTARWGGAA